MGISQNGIDMNTLRVILGLYWDNGKRMEAIGIIGIIEGVRGTRV